jgi:hypothetical protein
MIGSADILNAIRELTNSKQLDRSELHGLLEDGIHAALAKSMGPTCRPRSRSTRTRARFASSF